MTDPATPRSSRHGTPNTSRDGDTPGQVTKTPEIMTPGRKIQAMLAQFDSDSDSGNERETAPKPRNPAPTTESTSATRNPTGPFANPQAESDNEDDEELSLAPRGRLAARMQGGAEDNAQRAQPARETHQSDGSSSETLKTRPDAASNASDNDSDDDVRAPGRRRRAVQSSPPPETSRRSTSPLFVPQDSPVPDSEQEEPNPGDDPEQGRENNAKNPRFQELVARKRKEREEKERIEEEKRAARIQRSSDLGIEFSEDGGDADDDEAGQKLTQQSKPTARKASKKAVLEMNRETQRMNRNMQLAHQATTKKKFTLDGFMARFNRPQSKDGSATAASSHHPSDTEARHPDSTPPTSPPPALNPGGNDLAAKLDSQANLNAESGASEQPAFESTKEIHAQSVPAEQDRTQEPAKEAKPSKKSVRVKLSPRSVAQTQNYDSDSDLEVVTSPTKARKLAIFENLQPRQSHHSQSLQTLRALANLSGASRNTLSTMNQAELEATLLRRARQQAAQEREEKIRRLREKGVVVQTAEERHRTENDVEDVMQKARDEADTIAKQEKAAAKKKGEDTGDALDGDSDEDYDGDQGEPDEDEIDSEEEDDEPDDDDDDEDDKVQVKQSSDLVDNQAEETGESESEAEDNEGDNLGPDEVNGSTPLRTGRKKFVVSDDEEDDEGPPLVVSTPRPKVPNLGKTSGDFLGLSQAFAATLATSQDETEEDSLANLREMPGMGLPAPDVLEPDSQGLVRDSQDQQSGSLDLLGDYTQAGAGVADSPSARTLTQYSQAPEPTQDAGFVMSPFDQHKRFAEHPTSTIDTVPLNPEETPLVKKGMRRLRRGPQATTHVSDDEEVSTNRNAFDVMGKDAKKPQTPYDRKKSKAKHIVDEAAEESEDEYAGLGGASDEDSGAEDDYDRGMINDESGEVVDEKELAALNANFDRERDEKDVNKLMKDITTGGLRRKRAGGDDFDLSESEDERVEARRRQKRREFAKMRKALLEDDKLSKMADDPKKAAFLRSIEDRDFGDEMDFLVDEHGGDNGADNSTSQENATGQEGQDGQESGPGRKRPLDQTSADALNRPPAKHRRKAAQRKPTSLAEIRQSVSFLLDGPETHEPGSHAPEDEEPEEQNDEDELSRSDTTVRRGGGGVDNPTTTTGDTHQAGEVTYNNPRRKRGAAVVDRLSLRRAASSNATSAAASKPAFYTSGSGNASPSFNGPPPLLSRKSSTAATTASSTTTSLGSNNSNSSRGTGKSEVTAGGVGGGKKAAAVNYYAAAREKAREVELKRKDNERRERKLGLGAMKGHGDRLKGLLGGQKSGQWE